MTPEQLTNLFQQHQPEFHPVVPFDPAIERICAIDLTAANTSLAAIDLSNTDAFSSWIGDQLSAANARYAIGGYNEHRTVYGISPVFDAAGSSAEPRRLHLGTDIWGAAHTPVMAPLQGTVHSFAFNDRIGDYGGTIILNHSLDGHRFHTLYGHLGVDELKNLYAGKEIHAGETIGYFGIPAENGGWPPHLHFQLIHVIGDWKGDYPGVCAYSERATWLANSPDPEWLLQLNRYL